jgi:IS5 family transposase
MPWQQIEASVAHLFSRKARAAQAMPDLDRFGEAAQPLARKSNAGRPRVPLRIMMALLYLKHAFNLSDEAVVERGCETPRWQYVSGLAYDEERRPCDATTRVTCRRLLGEEGVEALLAQTVNLAVSLKLLPAAALATVVVDATVPETAVAHPTDSKLLETARAKLVAAAQDALRVWGEGGHCRHPPAQPDRGRPCVPRQPVRRTHPQRAAGAGGHRDAGDGHEACDGVCGPGRPGR